MLRIGLSLLAVATGLFILMGAISCQFGAPKFESQTAYTIGELKDFADHGDWARAFVIPRIFPIDILLLLSLGFGLALCSVSSAFGVPALRSHARWFVLLPAAYMVFDLLEDISLVRLISAPKLIDDASVEATKVLTRIKLAVLVLAVVQTALVAIYALWVRIKAR